MVIDPRVLSKTAKTMAPKKERLHESQVRGTVVYRGGDHYIQLDGAPSDFLTPVANLEEGLNDSGFVHGDRVLVLIKNHQAIVTKNITTGLQAQSAKIAKETAEEAQAAAGRAIGYAQEANLAAEEAKADASEASAAAQAAQESADTANEAAQNAQESADSANIAANHAETSANAATIAANNALSGLSTLEGVIDTVNWFAEHKKATTDTTVNPNKTYYIYDEVTGTLSAVEPVGTENPSQEGWYELDEAISNYVATRIAETDDGLYVVGQANGWKVLVSSGEGDYAAGIYLLDPQSGIVQASTASGISFNGARPFVIGNNNTFIHFDPTNGGKITIGGGSNVEIGSGKTLNDIITAVEYGIGSSPSSHSDINNWSTNTPTWTPGSYIWMRTTKGNQYTYTCIQGAKGENGSDGEDATVLRIDSSRGTVFKNNQVSTVLNVTIYSGPDTITDITSLRSKFGSGARLQWYWLRIDDSDYGIIVSTDHKLSRDGFSLTLTPDEVDVKVTFKCELII